MQEELKKFIHRSSFPCIMAKAVAKKGLMHVLTVNELNSQTVEKVLSQLYEFIDLFRLNEEKLASFAVVLETNNYSQFEHFEKAFWNFLALLHQKDKNHYAHDPRVSSDPRHNNFSYSIKSEAFFILALHPESPRFARRFGHPAIIFNPHQQFEHLRARGVFAKVRDLIRWKDKLIQGSVNPMLNDFGEISEVFQYTGRVHNPNEPLPLQI